MKALIWLALSSTLSQTAFAGSSIKPEISIGLNADSFKRDVNLASSLLGTLEPTIKWFTSGKLPKGDIDYEVRRVVSFICS